MFRRKLRLSTCFAFAIQQSLDLIFIVIFLNNDQSLFQRKGLRNCNLRHSSFPLLQSDCGLQRDLIAFAQRTNDFQFQARFIKLSRLLFEVQKLFLTWRLYQMFSQCLLFIFDHRVVVQAILLQCPSLKVFIVWLSRQLPLARHNRLSLDEQGLKELN